MREVGVCVEVVPERASRGAAGVPPPSGAIEGLSDPRQHATVGFPGVVVERRTRQERRHRLVRGVRHRRRVGGIERTPRASTRNDAPIVRLPRAVAVLARRGRETQPVPIHRTRERRRGPSPRGEKVAVQRPVRRGRAVGPRAAAERGSRTFSAGVMSRVAPRVRPADAARAAAAPAAPPPVRDRERSESVRASVRVGAASFRQRRRRAFGDDAEPFPQFRSRLSIRRLGRRRRDDFSHARRRRRRGGELQTRNLVRPALHRRGRRPRVLHRPVYEREEVFRGGVSSRRPRRRGGDGARRGESKV